MKNLVCLWPLFIYSLTLNAHAYLKQATLRATDGTEIFFYYDVEEIDGNQRGMNISLLTKLNISLSGNFPHPQTNSNPGSLTLFWYRTCDFDLNDGSADSYQKTYRLDYYILRGNPHLLVIPEDRSPQVLKLTTPDRQHSCHWIQELEVTINGQQLIDPINGTNRFRLNLNY